MESVKILKNSQIIVLGLCIAGATIAASLILSQGFLRLMKFSKEMITVTGSAEKEIKSDYIVWTGSFSRRDPALATAYQKLAEDLLKVRAYLHSRGVREGEFVVSQLETTPLYRRTEKGVETNEIEGYRLKQSVTVRSGEVEKIDRLSREATELIPQGVQLESNVPEYFYTKLDDLKIEMLAQASENARRRAAMMAQSTGNKIGFIRSARMGVFQITPVNSTEVSDWGVNDTTSLEKKVTAVVNVSFSIQ